MRKVGVCAKLCLRIVVGLPIIMAGSILEAGELRFESLVLRGGPSGSSLIGDEQQTDFNQVDLAVTIRLPVFPRPDPWEWELGSGWVVKTRLLASAGVLRGARETSGVFTLVPMDVMFGRKDGLVSVDMGVGGALVSDYKFDHQNLGGPFQFVWTFGVTSRFAGPFGVGYHFQHYSDATLYGHDSRGVDLHLFELIYWFKTGH